jgi:hypothetical protein
MALDSTPEIDELVDEIRAHGDYASQSDVVEAALRLLREQQLRDSRKLFVSGSSNTRRRSWAIGFWAIKILTTIVALVACAVDVESIVATLPVLTIAGLALALLTRPLGSWKVIAYCLSGPLISSLCAAFIAGFRWSQGEAQVPITTILFFYALYSLPAAIVIAPEIFRWFLAPYASAALPLQFSLKSLLLLTTALCIVLPLFGFVFRNSTRGDYLVFGLFTLVTIGLVALAMTIFITDRQRRRISLAATDANQDRQNPAG